MPRFTVLGSYQSLQLKAEHYEVKLGSDCKAGQRRPERRCAKSRAACGGLPDG